MSRTAIAIIGLVGVAGVNVLGPAVAQRISHVVGYGQDERGSVAGGVDMQLASGLGEPRSGDHAGWDSHTLLDGR